MKNTEQVDVSSEKIEFETKSLVTQNESKKPNIFNESTVSNETKHAQKENNIYLQVHLLLLRLICRVKFVFQVVFEGETRD